MEINSVYRIAAGLEQVWQSRVLGAVGNSAIKVIKMGGEGIAAEAHDDFDELLLVWKGAAAGYRRQTVQPRRRAITALCRRRRAPRSGRQLGTLLLVDIRDAPAGLIAADRQVSERTGAAGVEWLPADRVGKAQLAGVQHQARRALGAG
nr:Uncharacterised protein [Raoultella sp. NCTC 9187]